MIKIDQFGQKIIERNDIPNLSRLLDEYISYRYWHSSCDDEAIDWCNLLNSNIWFVNELDEILESKEYNQWLMYKDNPIENAGREVNYYYILLSDGRRVHFIAFDFKDAFNYARQATTTEKFKSEEFKVVREEHMNKYIYDENNHKWRYNKAS